MYRELNLRQIGDRRTSRVLLGDDDGDLVDLKSVSATRVNAVKTPRKCTFATLSSLFDVATTESNP